MNIEIDNAVFSTDYIVEHLDWDYIDAMNDSYSPLGEYSA